MFFLKEDLFAKANAFASLRSRLHYVSLEMTNDVNKLLHRQLFRALVKNLIIDYFRWNH